MENTVPYEGFYLMCILNSGGWLLVVLTLLILLRYCVKCAFSLMCQSPIDWHLLSSCYELQLMDPVVLDILLCLPFLKNVFSDVM